MSQCSRHGSRKSGAGCIRAERAWLAGTSDCHRAARRRTAQIAGCPCRLLTSTWSGSACPCSFGAVGRARRRVRFAPRSPRRRAEHCSCAPSRYPWQTQPRFRTAFSRAPKRRCRRARPCSSGPEPPVDRDRKRVTEPERTQPRAGRDSGSSSMLHTSHGCVRLSPRL